MRLRLLLPSLSVALLVVLAPTVAGAQPFTCTAAASVPPTIRSEGRNELVTDLLLTCTGGVPTANGQPIPAVDVSLFIDPSITSRVLVTPWSEALPILDEA